MLPICLHRSAVPTLVRFSTFYYVERLERERLGERNFVNDDAQYFTIPENFQSGEKQKRNIFLPQNVKNQL